MNHYLASTLLSSLDQLSYLLPLLPPQLGSQFKPNAEQQGMVCNVWVWCPDPSGQCWSPDAWNHTSGECWLKFQQHWDNSVDLRCALRLFNSCGEQLPPPLQLGLFKVQK